MKIIHMNGFTDDERNSYKSLIFNNTFHGMKTIVTAARDLGVEIKEDKNKVIWLSPDSEIAFEITILNRSCCAQSSCFSYYPCVGNC
jgi:hypothetical protein